MTAALLAAVLALIIQDRPVDPAADLAAARALYGTAAYEEALTRLSRISPPDALQDQVETYRALCLLALGRTLEAERTVEQILQRNPRYVPDEADVSPRLVIVFRSVRARLLPESARRLYATARTNFDAGKFDLAAGQLRELLTLVGDATDGGLADMKVLAEGFLKLAESSRAAAPTDAAQAPAPALPGASASTSEGPVYSILDRDVVAPVEISRPVPIMKTPKGGEPALYQGLIEVVIDEQGRVESAVIRRAIEPTFDAELLAAAKTWRFQAATRNAKPVKYRRAYEIIGHSRLVPPIVGNVGLLRSRPE